MPAPVRSAFVRVIEDDDDDAEQEVRRERRKAKGSR